MKKEKLKKIFYLMSIVTIFTLLSIGCVQKQIESDVTGDLSLSKIKESGIIVVGINIPYEPMEFKDESGKLVGIDVDVMNKIASGLWVSVEFKELGWDEMFEAVKSGEVDVAISSITITPERSQEMLFSIPYFNGGQVIVINNDNEDILFLEDLKGRKVGVQEETTSHEEALKYTDSDLVVVYKDGYEVAEIDLKNKAIDAIIIDYVAALTLVKNNPSLKIVGDPFTQEFYGIATNNNNHELIDEINKLLGNAIWAGELKEINNVWME